MPTSEFVAAACSAVREMYAKDGFLLHISHKHRFECVFIHSFCEGGVAGLWPSMMSYTAEELLALQRYDTIRYTLPP